MIMSLPHPTHTSLDKEDLPLSLPIPQKELPYTYKEIPKPVNPGKILILKMMVIMGSLGAILMVMSMLAILFGW